MPAAPDSLLVTYVLLALVLGVVSSLIWQRKGGRTGSGFLLGALLGLIGLLIVVLSNPMHDPVDPLRPSPYIECPYCRERMRRDASVCPHCRRELVGASFTWHAPSSPPPPPPPST